jgi:hypothetical protein
MCSIGPLQLSSRAKTRKSFRAFLVDSGPRRDGRNWDARPRLADLLIGFPLTFLCLLRLGARLPMGRAPPARVPLWMFVAIGGYAPSRCFHPTFLAHASRDASAQTVTDKDLMQSVSLTFKSKSDAALHPASRPGANPTYGNFRDCQERMWTVSEPRKNC